MHSDVTAAVLIRPNEGFESPGSNGTHIFIETLNLTHDEILSCEKLFEKFQIDQCVSEKISLHRYPGEHRNENCMEKQRKMKWVKEILTPTLSGNRFSNVC